MHWFGETSCGWCNEIIMPDDGIFIPSTSGPRLFHRVCFLRQVVGSVGHQQKKCTCYGGIEGDPPGLTRLEAAQAAVDFFEQKACCWK